MTYYSATVALLLCTLKMFAEIVFLPMHVFRLFQKPEKCPPIKNRILLISAADLAERIRKKEISCVTVLEAYISRINEVNPIINAVIENRFEAALEDAKKVDNFINNSGLNEEQLKQKYPLLGVPITIKGSLAVTGMLHSAGSLNHSVRADNDATAVKYVKDAGAIPLLISNVPELCFSWETENKLIGVTSNPYDNTRTCGGSSGGEASLLSSGASVIGLGSDLAGSLRVPAHYCGIWGHKPSPRVVSGQGHYPNSESEADWNKLFTIGPITRYATDLRFLLNIIAEPNGRNLLKLDQKVDLRKLKIYFMKDVNSVLSTRLNHNVISAIEKVVSYFHTKYESKCVEVHLPPLKYFAELCNFKITQMDMHDVDSIFGGKDATVYYEIIKYFGGRSNHVMSALGYGMIKHLIQFVSEDTTTNTITYFEEMREQFLNILGDDGILIAATSPTEALYHKDVYRKPFDYGYCAIFNIFGFPVTTCPVGFTKEGLPVGIQVIAAPNLDRYTLSVAEELERAFGGWKFS